VEVRNDLPFLREAAAANLMEIRLGELAQKQGGNVGVRQFGRRMVADHTRLEQELSTLVSGSGNTLNATLTPEHYRKINNLQNLSGDEFDRAYMSMMVQDHQTDVSQFETQSRNADSPRVRELASRSLPVLRQHLSYSQQVGRQVNADGNVATGNANIQADLPLIRELANGNLMEVSLGRMAQTKASNRAVRDFGERMVNDHSNMQQQLTSMASSNGASVRPALSTQQQLDMNHLQRLSGADFDRAYMEMMIRDHQDEVDRVESESQDNHSNPVQTLLNNSLPTLRQHLRLAQQVGRQVNADVATTEPSDDGQRNENVRADRKFIHEVAADNMLEVQLGELAERKSQNASVRRLAERIIADHNRLQDTWVGMSSRNGHEFRPGMGRNHRAKLNQLQNLSGRAFDRAYISMVVQNRKDYIDYFEREGRAAQSSQVRNLVNRGIPVLRRHFNQAKQIGGPLGADTSATLRSEREGGRGRGRGYNN
jgi:putative membrane protein